MRRPLLGPLALLVACFSLLVWPSMTQADNVANDATQQTKTSNSTKNEVKEIESLPPSAIISVPEGAKVNGSEKLFFGSYSTTTYTVVSASTSTVFYSCLSGTSGTVCQGRRKRKTFSIPRATDGDDVNNAGLEGSLNGEEELSEAPETRVESNGEEGNGEGKFSFTVWTISRTTTSVTVFFTNTSSTVRISYYCRAGGLVTPALSCG
ncbi:hypothetical protein Pmani_021662 [Petrolisthes manimaculis]|uniref:Uncharacterized protein n=1 Tax=Petrolisthes manimaculis TaxID=1843537 RepID=A0AAE1PEB8_9EUCA|nr:hypothetical protein Pmani_021662 [Petrolisthes manimaculis]